VLDVASESSAFAGVLAVLWSDLVSVAFLLAEDVEWVDYTTRESAQHATHLINNSTVPTRILLSRICTIPCTVPVTRQV
jgi:hypothetical protein